MKASSIDALSVIASHVTKEASLYKVRHTNLSLRQNLFEHRMNFSTFSPVIIEGHLYEMSE
jgi:hypothetical protein